MFCSEFQLFGGTDLCSGELIAPNSSCTVEVFSCPTDDRSSSALIEFTTNAAGNNKHYAAIAKQQSPSDAAKRRLPPVMSDFVIRDNQGNPITGSPLEENQNYTLEWTTTGYEQWMTSLAAIYNCSGVASFECARTASSNLLMHSGFITTPTISIGEWSYEGVTSNDFLYSYSFTTPLVSSHSILITMSKRLLKVRK